MTEPNMAVLAANRGRSGGNVRIHRHSVELNLPQPRSGVVVPVVPGPSLERSDLQSAYDRYRAVSGGGAPDLIDSPDMLLARVTLIRTLLADGWVAPPAVMNQLAKDEAQLRPRLLVAS